MTVSTTASGATFIGNGSTTVFSAAINNGVPFNSNTSLATYTVIYTDTDGAVTTLSPSSYGLAFTAAVTGSLWGVGVSLTYPLSGSPIASGTNLTLSRVFPLQQLTSISNQGDFAPQNVEAMGDIEEMQLQQIAARTGQFRGEWVQNVQYNYADYILDGPNGSDTGNYYMCLVPNISGTWTTDLAAGDWVLVIDISAITASATSASGSASAAAISATSAAASATTASGYVATVVASAAAAATSATNAATSATSASTSATTATTQASTATTEAGIATTQATNAATSATSAATSATSAATSATNAATSATSAATSATSAATSATNAAGTLYSTSTTSLAIGVGTKTFATQTGKNYNTGQFIIAASNANTANYMHGQVTSYSGTSLMVNVLDVGGSGTFADWDISVSGNAGPSGGGTGTVTSVSVTTANGVSGTVANATTTPAVTLALGAITPSSVVASGSVTGSNISGTTSGTNTGDQTVPSNTTSTANQFFTAYNSTTGAFTKAQPTDANLSTSDVTTNNVVSTKHGFAPKSPADAAQFLNGAATPAYAAVKDSDLSTSDITTNNVVSTKHGFAPKSPADATKFLNGAATPAYAQVKDSDLTFTDITTNNSTTSLHGFLKKLSGTATQYMGGDGNWTVPIGGDPGSSIGANGYQKFASGLIIQWGFASSSVNLSTQTVSFPLTFPNACLSVISNPQAASSSGGDVGYITVQSVSTSNFVTIYSCNRYWAAVGY